MRRRSPSPVGSASSPDRLDGALILDLVLLTYHSRSRNNSFSPHPLAHLTERSLASAAVSHSDPPAPFQTHAITDEASPFALRSTRNHPRTAMHLRCRIGLAVGRLCQSPECWMVLGGIPAESPSATRSSVFRSDQSLDGGRAERRRGRACRLARADAVTILAEDWAG